MHISPQPDVIRQIPAVMVRIVIEDDLVRIPQPAIAERDVIRRYAEIKSAEPETSRSAACQPPVVAWPKTAGESPMLPWMIQVVVWVTAARIVAHPTIMIYMRSVGVSLMIAEVPMFLRRMWRSMKFSGPVRRRWWCMMLARPLRNRRQTRQHGNSEESNVSSHCVPPSSLLNPSLIHETTSGRLLSEALQLLEHKRKAQVARSQQSSGSHLFNSTHSRPTGKKFWRSD